MKRSIFYRFALLAIFAICLGNAASAKPPGESDFIGAQLTGEDVSIWLKGLDKQPKSIGIFSVHVHQPLDPEFADVMQNQIQKAMQTETSMRVIVCEECHTPQVQLKGDRLVVTKGAPDLQTMSDYGKKNEVDTFLTVDVYRTKLSMISQISLFDATSGQVLGSTEIKIPAFDLDDSSVQIMVKFGPGIVIGGDSSSGDGTSSTPPLGGAVEFLEELGFGKGGVTVGGAGSSAGSMLFVLPTLAWRGRFGATGMTSLKGVGLGFGKTGDSWGVSAGLSYDVFLGSFTSVGLQAYAVVPTSSSNGTNNGINGFIGVSIGFSIGR